MIVIDLPSHISATYIFFGLLNLTSRASYRSNELTTFKSVLFHCNNQVSHLILQGIGKEFSNIRNKIHLLLQHKCAFVAKGNSYRLDINNRCIISIALYKRMPRRICDNNPQFSISLCCDLSYNIKQISK